ncbi:MAG: hypothetical protein ACKO3N_09625 [Verrucomicrobiota bacterium]
MARPALGRGLATLLSPAQPATDPGPARPAGVQLLLRGADGTELVPPEPPHLPDPQPPRSIPRWVLGSAVLADALLLLVAAWVVVAGRDWGRFVAATLLVSIGGGMLAAAAWPRGHAAARERETLNPLAEEKPRVRVRFMDELPRPRPGR